MAHALPALLGWTLCGAPPALSSRANSSRLCPPPPSRHAACHASLTRRRRAASTHSCSSVSAASAACGAPLSTVTPHHKLAPPSAPVIGFGQAMARGGGRRARAALRLRALAASRSRAPLPWADPPGGAQVDLSASVSDAWLASAGFAKGSRTVVDAALRSKVLASLEENSYACHAGGSLSNTLVALARLAAAAHAQGGPLGGGAAPLQPAPHAALSAAVGDDPFAAFFRAQMLAAGVALAPSSEREGGVTGTVVVLTTPDAQRTMLSCLGSPAQLRASAAAASASGCKLLILEGYLLEEPGCVAPLLAAAAAAKAAGGLVALTCADAGVVRSHAAAFNAILGAGVDVLFANAAEAEALSGVVSDPPAAAAALAASGARIAVVTDGSKGACVAAGALDGGAAARVAPFWTQHAPVDTCGAGDGFAAGFLHALLRGAPLPEASSFAARVASAVITRPGGRLAVEEAGPLAAHFAVRAAAWDGAAAPIV